MMQMRRIVVTLTIIFCSAAVGRGGWEKRDSGSLAWLYAVEFVDYLKGYAAGSNGTLLVTEDGGRKWKKVALGISDTIRDIHFTDDHTGWMLCSRERTSAGGKASYLLKSDDGGRTWVTVQLPDIPARFSRMFFGSNGVGYLVGEGGVVAGIGRDGSLTARSYLSTRFLMTGGAVPDGVQIVLAGGGGSLFLSKDAGKNWETVRFRADRPEYKLNSVFFADAQLGWVAGNGGTIFSTVDGGHSWLRQNSGIEIDLNDICFWEREIGFAVGEQGIVLRTSDGGRTWLRESSGTRHPLERIAIAGDRAVAVGFGGTIITTDLSDGRSNQGREQQ